MMLDDASMMRRAIANAATARLRTAPNPWVGAVLIDTEGSVYDGATHQPGGLHAEREVLVAAGDLARGSTLFTTLEPCNHVGRTGACTEALVEARVGRVVVGIADPDDNVRGAGIEALRAAGIDVTVGVEAAAVTEQLAPYITHRRTGRPHVILKLAMTLDGFIAAPDGTSQWITGERARADVHRLRAESGAVVVGAGTVRVDLPSLTVRDFTPPLVDDELTNFDPWRIVLGSIVLGSSAGLADDQPIEVWDGDLEALLDELGERQILQLLVEGGGAVAGSFHRAGLVDDYYLYMAPAIMGGADAVSAFGGDGAPTMADIQRGTFVSVTPLGDDLRLIYRPT